MLHRGFKKRLAMRQDPPETDAHQIGAGQASLGRKLKQLAPIRRRQSDFKSRVALHTANIRHAKIVTTHQCQTAQFWNAIR
jgi:hypothetical protein